MPTTPSKQGGFKGGHYACTEEKLYKKAIALLEKCKVENQRYADVPAAAVRAGLTLHLRSIDSEGLPIACNAREERSAKMGAKRRRQILKRLNTLDTGITQEDRRTKRQAAIERTIEAEKALKWGRLQ